MPDATHSQHLDRFSCTDLPKDATVDPAEVSQNGAFLRPHLQAHSVVKGCFQAKNIYLSILVIQSGHDGRVQPIRGSEFPWVIAVACIAYQVLVSYGRSETWEVSATVAKAYALDI